MKTNKTEVRTMLLPYRVIEVKPLTEASYIVRFDKSGLQFRPGQYLVVGLHGNDEAREYSIYSGKDDDFLDILVRRVENGLISLKLSELSSKDHLEISGPFGFFLANAQPPDSKKFLFLASGTGIAPFHSFIRSYPDADYTILHGIRTINETYGIGSYRKGKYISCTSRDKKGDHAGHLTSFLKELPIDEEVIVYLCGNSKMIFDSIDILHQKGIPNTRIYTEVYF